MAELWQAWKSCRQLPWQFANCPHLPGHLTGQNWPNCLININVSIPEQKLHYQKLNSNKLYETQGEKKAKHELLSISENKLTHYYGIKLHKS
jgi:hypothetical protein